MLHNSNHEGAEYIANMETPFLDRLQAAQAQVGSCLCVGLDPDAERLPAFLRYTPPPAVFTAYLADVVRAAAPYACAFKANSAFFEAYGSPGVAVMEEALRMVRRIAPHALIVLDGKRGDIGNTARMYAHAAYDRLGVDAMTVSPYMGRDSVTPFLDTPGRCAFVLARTSNTGAADVQERPSEGKPLYTHVVTAARQWANTTPGTLGFVVGATATEAIAETRRLAPDAPLLIPGIGTQGGDLAATLAANAGGPVLVNVGREILYGRPREQFRRRHHERRHPLCPGIAGGLKPPSRKM